MSNNKQPLKSGEKILFGIVAVFIGLAVVGYAALETYRLNRDAPLFVNKTHYKFSEEGHKGSRIFRVEGRCTACHRALRNGTNMGLSLDGVGSVRTLDWLVAFLEKPEEIYGAKVFDHGVGLEAAYVARMPEEQRHAMAVFISELKSEQGSSSAAMPPEGRSEFIDNMVGAWAPPEWKEKYTDIRDKVPTSDQKPETQNVDKTTSVGEEVK